MPAWVLPTSQPVLVLQEGTTNGNGAPGAPAANGAFLEAYVPVLLGVGLLVGAYILLSGRRRDDGAVRAAPARPRCPPGCLDPEDCPPHGRTAAYF